MGAGALAVCPQFVPCNHSLSLFLWSSRFCAAVIKCLGPCRVFEYSVGRCPIALHHLVEDDDILLQCQHECRYGLAGRVTHSICIFHGQVPQAPRLGHDVASHVCFAGKKLLSQLLQLVVVTVNADVDLAELDVVLNGRDITTCKASA